MKNVDFEKLIGTCLCAKALSFLLVSLFLFATACGTQDKAVLLEITENFDDAASYNGSFLVFRIYQNNEAEFDCIRNADSPLSRSNILTKQITVSEEDANQIRASLKSLDSSEYLERYELKEKWSDVKQFTTLSFSHTGKDKNRKILVDGDLLNSVKMKIKSSDLPETLVNLIENVVRIRSVVCK